jgi:hypothetical protein
LEELVEGVEELLFGDMAEIGGNGLRSSGLRTQIG